MLYQLTQNLGTIVVAAAVAAAVILVIRILYKDRKAGKSSCGAGCAGCPSSGACHAAVSGRLEAECRAAVAGRREAACRALNADDSEAACQAAGGSSPDKALHKEE